VSSPVPPPDLTTAAARIISNLLGRRWTWPRRRVVDVYRVPYGTRFIRLWGSPVSAVNSVAGPTGEIIDPSKWQLNNGNQLWFLEPQDWWFPGGYWDIAAPPPWMNMSWVGRWGPQNARDISVDYLYGSPPPIDVQRAVNQLALQFAFAEACSPECKLPERVQNVSREGVSWTLIDPQDFLDRGRTGLYYVDLVLTSYATGKAGTGRASIMSPELPPPRRIKSTIVT
jgi:hypothetical protein